MSSCLYCQRESPPGDSLCAHCGMPLPAHTDAEQERRLRRFRWFCIGLTLFCAVMVVWLPRSIG
ncbi:MAG TPA: DnrP protein [Pseudomonas sp.]|nr:DnrP protein [Pseudomonas sp.]